MSLDLSRLMRWSTASHTTHREGFQHRVEFGHRAWQVTEQERIVNQLDAIASIVTFLEMGLAASVARVSRLRQSILTRAFSGALLRSAVDVSIQLVGV
jgi:hypothetical protein